MHGGRDVTLFDRFAPLYERAMPAADRDVLEAGLAYATRPVTRLLDVGGGTGRASRALSVPEPVVVDAAGGMLREATTRGLAAVQGDATRLPVQTASVDAVVIVDALHHMPRHRAVIAEAARVLRPGGVLVVREFDPETLRGRALVAVERLVGFDSTFDTPHELAGLMKAAGLEPAVPDTGFGFTVVGRMTESETHIVSES
ncbi:MULTISPECIES: class I SAM-dependent methyltransferase [unclassified Haladaptatus]|uniref:class I SAM-dependent methyltransferase n=1 Tax=unclassified Haladaptatus TaxID=2622732 RepID=UPI0023E8985A|nr:MULTISPECIES: methyltransferase domain-containing protein [unclassified Haladaptatus]